MMENDTPTTMAEYWAGRDTDSEAAIAAYLAEMDITEKELKDNLDHPAIYRKTLAELGR